MLKLLVATAVLTFLASPGPVADDGKLSYRQLTWEDFQVNDSIASPHKALTHWGVHASYKFSTRRASGGYVATITSFTMYSYVEPGKCWRRSKLPRDEGALLKHEQGHFDIAELGVRTTMSLPESTYPSGWGQSSEAASADIKGKMRVFREGRAAEIRDLQTRYDETTNHSRIKDVQEKWNQYLEAKLKNPALQLAMPS